MAEKTAENSDVNINVLMYDERTDYKAPQLNPIEEDKNAIHILINNTIAESPILENGNIKIWEEDCKSPLLIRMLMERIDSFRC